MKKLILAIALISLLAGSCARGRVETNTAKSSSDSTATTPTDTSKH